MCSFLIQFLELSRQAAHWAGCNSRAREVSLRDQKVRLLQLLSGTLSIELAKLSESFLKQLIHRIKYMTLLC
jgi:hypothetical protein